MKKLLTIFTVNQPFRFSYIQRIPLRPSDNPKAFSSQNNHKSSIQHLEVRASTFNDHRQIFELLESKNTIFYLQPLRRPPYKLFVKYVPINVPIADIEEDLCNQTVPFIKINFFQNRQKQKILKQKILITANRKNVDKVTSLKKKNISVKNEIYKSTPVPQCFNYQSFVHSSLCCNRHPRCIKCGLNHENRNCLKIFE